MDYPMGGGANGLSNPAGSAGQDDSYTNDGFVDGEETTSKEFRRPNFEVDSMTEQRQTSSYNVPGMGNSIEEGTSTPLDSGSQVHRPSLLTEKGNA